MQRAGLIALLAFAASAVSLPGGTSAKGIDWVEKSNTHAQIVLEALAKFNPESAGAIGVEGLDEEIRDLKPERYERELAESEDILAELKRRLEDETDTKVRQDLGILVKVMKDSIRSEKLNRENMLPYYNLNQSVFRSVRALIDVQIPRERYPAAIVRIKRYAGIEDGFTPLTELARDRTSQRFDVDELVGPYRGEVEQDLERAETFIVGIEELLDGTDLQGWQEPYETLAGQLRDYNQWLRDEVLPRSRDDYRLPPVMYEDALRNWGVDASPEELIQQATQG